MSIVTKLGRMVINHEGSHKYSHMTLQSLGLLRSSDILKTLYLHYQSVYSHQTCQKGNLPWWAPTHKVRWPFDHQENNYIFTTSVCGHQTWHTAQKNEVFH